MAAGLAVERAEAEVAVGGEAAHPYLLDQGERLAVAGICLIELGRLGVDCAVGE